jgi:hypothetical protein
MDGTQLAASEKTIQVLYTITGQDCHPVAFGDLRLSLQPVCETVGAGVHFAEGQPPFWFFTSVDHCQSIRRVKLAPG